MRKQKQTPLLTDARNAEINTNEHQPGGRKSIRRAVLSGICRIRFEAFVVNEGFKAVDNATLEEFAEASEKSSRAELCASFLGGKRKGSGGVRFAATSPLRARNRTKPRMIEGSIETTNNPSSPGDAARH
ncbi:hypothetical protein PZN02_006348 (plasmid) [Sinorhizobium garamanticum]|uniref:Uncharacterized protein n=1 Tax=Sinorhizobium garamanticum TaxID=680247 RepID=A0ABY8DKU3_9HYPH|nr:hypothetical protein [Sinorhizobium garamanticum]WEX91529.1 hypothetical protein PZN02_006348 [Sinorhizobium garamanticum]